MAKKKKSTKKKKVVQEAAVYAPNPFWAYTGAILLFIVALFLLLGGFGTGGNLPVALFGAMYAVFGWAAYLTPVALVYWGVYKFTSEDHRIPLGRVFTMLAVLLLGLFNMMRGGSAERSQQLMRWRVILQFVAIVIMMATLYFASR